MAFDLGMPESTSPEEVYEEIRKRANELTRAKEVDSFSCQYDSACIIIIKKISQQMLTLCWSEIVCRGKERENPLNLKCQHNGMICTKVPDWLYLFAVSLAAVVTYKEEKYLVASMMLLLLHSSNPLFSIGISNCLLSPEKDVWVCTLFFRVCVCVISVDVGE